MKDYYLSYKNFYKRLEAEYKKYGELIIAFDFDDTVYNYHKISNRNYSRVINLLRAWANNGYLIAFTSREDGRIKEVSDFLIENKIPFNSINENKPGVKFGNNCKVYYNVLLDDRAGLGWAYKALLKIIKQIQRGKL